jgi:4-alpha-glucanotransferase
MNSPELSPELLRAAQARGVATSYNASHGREVTVAPATIEAILAALGDPPAPRADSAGQDGPGPSDADTAAWAGAAAPAPRRRSWGLTIQLYAVRSAASWGHGDFRDLAGLAAWSARELGAGFVLINPLHAAEPVPPISTSPYLPMSREFISPLYLRIEDIPEYAGLDERERGHLSALAKPLQAATVAGELIDRDAVWTAKRTALKILRQVPMSADRQAGYERFQAEGGEALRDWATWCVLAESHGPDWRAWPAGLARPDADVVEAERSRLSREADFHAWLQWLASDQLAAAQEAARAAGMDIGVIQDLAVGSSPAGADVWSHQDLFVPGVSVGAPPDEFNQRGQDWGSQPWHPERLAGQDYQALADLVGAATRSSGALRMDHVMGLFRLWWVPPGLTPDQGTYVSYDQVATVGVLARAAAERGFLVIGEDLGTIEPWIREYLSGHHVLGTSMLWFERDQDGAPLPPGQWRADTLATVGTHDMPPAAAFLTGEHVALRARLGVLARPESEEQADAERDLAAWQDALVREGLLPAGGSADLAQQAVALYAYLARTPSVLIGVSLPDAVGQRQPQNIPGTTDEYPNWRIPLADGDGRPVLLEDLAHRPELRAIADAVRDQG